jgi:hypothetical protein
VREGRLKEIVTNNSGVKMLRMRVNYKGIARIMPRIEMLEYGLKRTGRNNSYMLKYIGLIEYI